MLESERPRKPKSRTRKLIEVAKYYRARKIAQQAIEQASRMSKPTPRVG